MGLHGVCMIAAYGVAIQIAEILASNTALQTAMKTKYFNQDNGGHTNGYKLFNVHRGLGAFAFLASVVGVIAIFSGYGWTVFDYGNHAYYGIFMLAITILQMLLRISCPTVDAVFHRWLGRFICFWAFWCMYTGKEADLRTDGLQAEEDEQHHYWLTYTLFIFLYAIRLVILALRCRQTTVAPKHTEMKDGESEKDGNELELQSSTQVNTTV